MKKIITSILLLLTFLSFAYSQCNDFYKQTPNGTNIKVCTDGGWSPSDVALADQQTRAYAIEVIEGGNNSYNCHANAWYVSEGGAKVWINNMGSEANNINNYWNDGSYLEVINQPASMANVKVFYGSTTSLKDHSAITTSDPNIFISKMGCGVKCSHLKTNSPYDNSSLRYFVKDVEINGSTLLCNSNTITYTTLSFVNCTYNWTYDTSRFNCVSGQGTNDFQVAPKSPLVSGQAWVKLTLTVNLSTPVTREITKNVWVSSPSSPTYINGFANNGMEFGSNSVYNFSVDNYYNFPDFEWVVGGGTVISGQGTNAISVQTSEVTGSTNVYFDVAVRAGNCNLWGNYYFRNGYVTSGIGPIDIIISPNPSTGEASVELVNTNRKELIVVPEWELDIYDSMQSLKEKKTDLKAAQTKVNTSNWKDGIYIVCAKIGDEVITKKLMVKH